MKKKQPVNEWIDINDFINDRRYKQLVLDQGKGKFSFVFNNLKPSINWEYYFNVWKVKRVMILSRK